MKLVVSLVEFTGTIDLEAVVDIHSMETHFVNSEPFLRLEAFGVLVDGHFRELFGRVRIDCELLGLVGRVGLAGRADLHLLVVPLACFHF